MIDFFSAFNNLDFFSFMPVFVLSEAVWFCVWHGIMAMLEGVRK